MAKPSKVGDALVRSLKAANQAADDYAHDHESCESPEEMSERQVLTTVLYDLYSYFSEEGITTKQNERLQRYGFRGHG